MNWRERQALPGPRPRWKFASVVPQIVKDEKSSKGWKFVWPKKGQTYVKYLYDRRMERAVRATVKDFPLVDPPSA